MYTKRWKLGTLERVKIQSDLIGDYKLTYMFDIDKLGLSTINWNVDSKNKASDEFEEGTEKYYQNKLIRDFLTLLIDKRTVNILHRSIDNDTKLLTDIVEQLEGKSSTKEEPYGFYSLSTQTERKNDYITGKIGIGPFALNNNNHILTMLYDVRFKDIPGTIMSTLGLTNLASTEDFEHNSVMSWISALINAHVDIAKDPYISKLNVNPYTYNLVNTLIRTGFGRNTFYFTTQPIMKELAQAYMNAASMYMANKNKTQYQLQREAIEEVADARFGDIELLGVKYETWKNAFNPRDIIFLNAKEFLSKANGLFKQLVDNGVLERNANKEWNEVNGSVVEFNKKQVNLTPEQVQFVIYLANMQFEPYALSVSNLVKYSKIDTKKHGKSYIEQSLYEKGFDELFMSEDGGGLFEADGLERMARDSYILTKTRNAIAMTKSILKGQFLQATKAFDVATWHILKEIGRSDSKNVDLNNKIAKIIMAAIKSEFINDYAKKIRPNNPSYIRDLVSESEETFEYSQSGSSKEIVLSGESNYDLHSYVGGRALITFTATKGVMQIHQQFDGGVFVANVQDGENESQYTLSAPITGVNDSMNAIMTPITRKADSTGTVRIMRGKNTIVDRFDRLLMQIKQDPKYADILDQSGEPINVLLRSLVHGRTFDYKAPMTNFLNEMPDTYPNLKFLKLFNALDQNGVESNFIIDGWDELLHDNKHPLLKEFAEDLVVYAFVTSGDSQGFTKMFKQVPFSWRKESGYGKFIQDKIAEFESGEISTEVLRDAMLNNWFDNDIVRTYYSTRTGKDGKTQVPQFITYSGEMVSRGYAPQYNPLILAALTLNEETQLYEPSIYPNNAPRFIKVPRKNYKAAKDSQRAYTVYEKIDTGMKWNQEGKWIEFPIYVKVEPKGNQLKGDGGYLITEYGRDDSRVKEKTPNREALAKAYQLGDFISRQVVDEMSKNWGTGYAQIVESMNYRDMLRKFEGDMKKFNKAFENKYNKEDPTELAPEEQKTQNLFSNFLAPGQNIQSATDVLDAIISDKSISKISKDVAEKYKVVFEKYPINIDFAGMGNRGDWHAEFNQTRKSFSEIIIIPRILVENADSQSICEYVLHELTHAATSISINTNDDIKNAFENVIRYVKGIIEAASEEPIDWDKETQSKKWYGLSNANDFVAQVMSDIDFQGFLRAVPAMEKDEFDNIFEKVISIIKAAINKLFENNAPTNLLEQIRPMVESLANYQYQTKYESVKKQLGITQQQGYTVDWKKSIKRRENNTEENRLEIERILRATANQFKMFKNKKIGVLKRLKQLNDQFETSFEVKFDKNYNPSVPEKLPVKRNIQNIKSDDKLIEQLYSIIYSEPSYDSAVLLLQTNGYDPNTEESRIALGKLIKKLCRGE